MHPPASAAAYNLGPLMPAAQSVLQYGRRKNKNPRLCFRADHANALREARPCNVLRQIWAIPVAETLLRKRLPSIFVASGSGYPKRRPASLFGDDFSRENGPYPGGDAGSRSCPSDRDWVAPLKRDRHRRCHGRDRAWEGRAAITPKTFACLEASGGLRSTTGEQSQPLTLQSRDAIIRGRGAVAPKLFLYVRNKTSQERSFSLKSSGSL
ncbi:hypothetical protein MRB53_037482 [Persea americana]|nr:hypothetical protein MRB53_037482 [Persea americana]